MFFHDKDDINKEVEVFQFASITFVNMVNENNELLSDIKVPNNATVFLLCKKSGLTSDMQRWQIGNDNKQFYYYANVLAISWEEENKMYITFYSGSELIVEAYELSEDIFSDNVQAVSSDNIKDIVDRVYFAVHQEQLEEPEHICSINYDLISSNVKQLISTEISNLESIIETNKKAIDEALKNLELKENININTQVDSAGLNTVLSNIDTALINLENSLGSINSAIKEVDRVVDKDSANKTDSISLAVLKLESAAKILNDQIDASVDLNSRIRLNIDDIALAQNKLITSLNQHLVDSTTASSNLMSGIKAEVSSLKQQIVESNLIVQNLIQKVEQNDSNVVNSVSNLQNHISEISKRIDNYDLNICSAHMTKKKFFEDIIEFLKKGGLALIASFWAIVVILLIKEVIL